MSFLVTGMGRSGTLFLARELGKADGWTVFHEPDRHMAYHHVYHRFRGGRDRYGEVNSYLLSSALDLKAHVNRVAVIIRNPYDVARSMFRKGRTDAPVHVQQCLIELDRLLRSGWPVIRFSRMTTDREYLVECASLLGVKLDPAKVDLTPANSGEGDAEPSFNDEMRKEYNGFIERWRP